MLASVIDATSEFLFHTSPQCQQFINFLGCWPCHPAQGDFFDPLQQRIHVCERFCGRMHDACKDAMWGSSQVASVFADGIAMCRGLRLDVTKDEVIEESSTPAVAREHMGCLDMSETLFIGESWCDIPVDPVKASAAASRKSSLPSSTLQLWCLALLALFMLGDEPSADESLVKSTCNGSKSKRTTAWVPDASCSPPSMMLRAAILLCILAATHGSPISVQTVEAWATGIGEDLSSLASTKALRGSAAQHIYNTANYTVMDMDAASRVTALRGNVCSVFFPLSKPVFEDQMGTLNTRLDTLEHA